MVRSRAGEVLTVQVWNSPHGSQRPACLSASCVIVLTMALCSVTSPLPPCPSLSSSNELFPVFYTLHSLASRASAMLSPYHSFPISTLMNSSSFRMGSQVTSFRKLSLTPVRSEQHEHLSEPSSLPHVLAGMSISSAQNHADSMGAQQLAQSLVWAMCVLSTGGKHRN